MKNIFVQKQTWHFTLDTIASWKCKFIKDIRFISSIITSYSTWCTEDIVLFIVYAFIFATFWGNTNKSRFRRVEILQNKAIRMIYKVPRKEHITYTLWNILKITISLNIKHYSWAIKPITHSFMKLYKCYFNQKPMLITGETTNKTNKIK